MDTRVVPMFGRLSLVALLVTAACTPTVEYADPPAESYAAADFTVQAPTGTETMSGASTSEEFFRVTTVQPLIGRLFMEGEFTGEPRSVVVLSYDVWQRAFKGAPTVIGSSIQVNGQPTTIVGVTPKGFAKPNGAKLWIPKRSP